MSNIDWKKSAVTMRKSMSDHCLNIYLHWVQPACVNVYVGESVHDAKCVATAQF